MPFFGHFHCRYSMFMSIVAEIKITILSNFAAENYFINMCNLITN